MRKLVAAAVLAGTFCGAPALAADIALKAPRLAPAAVSTWSGFYVGADLGAKWADTTWTTAGGPYQVNGNLTVAAGATLTIQAGTTVYLGSGVNLAVANGGRLLAEGLETAPIWFASAPGSGLGRTGRATSPAACRPRTAPWPTPLT